MKFREWADALLKATDGAKYVPSLQALRIAGLSEAEAREFQRYLYGLGYQKLNKKQFYDNAKEWALSEYNKIKIKTILMRLENAD